MFFIFGVTQKRDDLELEETRLCNICGSFGRYEAFVKYNAFSLFFIPIFKWGRKYYMKANCCGSMFSIPEEKGKDIEYGRSVTINDYDLNPINTNYSKTMNCTHCGYEVERDHTFCPNCGKKL